MRCYIDEHFHETVSLDQLSHVAGLSRFHLLRTFRRRHGVPPHEYLVSARIEHARFLLEERPAARRCGHRIGVADQSHLHRHFKKLVGVTPGHYVRKVA